MRRQDYKPVPITPRDGGRLATDISTEAVGLANYRIKRNWRRYNDRERRREGYDYFRPDLTIPTGDQPLNAGSPITILFNGVRSNGQRAILGGTQTTLCRYIATESLDYCPGYAPGYFADFTTEWIPIGTGFSTAGHRWEVDQIGDDIVFNNGVDLPVSYSLNALQVTPLYELREQGVVATGTEQGYNNIQIFGDITQIKAGTNPNTGNTFVEDYFYPTQPRTIANQKGAVTSTTPTGSIRTASQAPGSYTVTMDPSAFFLGIFNAGMVGKTIVFANGFRATITAFIDTNNVTVDATPAAAPVLGTELVGAMTPVPNLEGAFYLPSVGSYVFNGPPGTNIVVPRSLSTDIYNPGDTFNTTGAFGWVFLYGHSLSLKKVLSIGGGNLTLNFSVVSTGDTDYRVVTRAPAFDASMVGLRLFFPTGDVRTIVSFIDSQTVVVDSFRPIFLYSTAGGQEYGYTSFEIENPQTYSTIQNTATTDRIEYRALWSGLQGATRFASSIPCSIALGSKQLILDYPAKSLSAGQEVVVLGAGVAGGNLTATIVQINGLTVLLDTPADTAVGVDNLGIGEGLVQASDMTGSIVGFYDLQQDGTAILRMMELNGTLVVYREKGYELAEYTGVAASPFQFTPIVYTNERSLLYRYSLINVTGTGQAGQGISFHLFAGANGFYRFDMISKLPVEFEPFQVCQRSFLEPASRITSSYGIPFGDLVFACENELTKEVFFCAPTAEGQAVMCLDYVQNTVSMMDYIITAGVSIDSPYNGERLFICGNSDGQVLTYGKANILHPEWFSSDQSVVVSGAGTTGANQTYTLQDTLQNGHQWWATADGNYQIFWNNLTGYWTIGEFISAPKNLYKLSDHIVPWISGWEVVLGVSPAPTVSNPTVTSEIFNRLGQDYESDSYSGLGSPGSSFYQKTINAHMLELSSFTENINITVSLYGSESPNSRIEGQEKLLATKTFTNASVTNVFNVYYCATYFADRIVVTGDGPCEFVNRIFSLDILNTKGSTHSPY